MIIITLIYLLFLPETRCVCSKAAGKGCHIFYPLMDLLAIHDALEQVVAWAETRSAWEQALSTVGRCRSFDASGDGYGRGEGFAVAVLCPTDSAAPYTPMGVLCGSAVNQVGLQLPVSLPVFFGINGFCRSWHLITCSCIL